MVELCPGISTAATLSSVPAACGLARLKNDTNATTMPSTTIAMTRILPEGRFFLAVPNSSPMLMVGPPGVFGGSGTAGVAGGVVGGSDMGLSFAGDFTLLAGSRRHWSARAGSPPRSAGQRPVLPAMLHCFGELGSGQSVQDV